MFFADVVGSTQLYRRLGDDRAEALVSACLERAVTRARGQGGSVVKTIGDAIMCVFPDAASAAQASAEIQRDTRTPLPDTTERLQLRLGFAAGEAVERDGDWFGDVVNIAARLSDLAKAGQVLTTEDTAAGLPDALRHSMRLFDKTPVKGISETLSVVQLVWDRQAHTEIFSSEGIVGATRLRLRYGDEEITLTPPRLPFVIGREAGCDLVVDAPFASRRHLRIEYRRGKFVLVDESTNGTWVAYGAGETQRAYLRNEPCTLFGAGRLWLGTAPGDDASMIGYLAE